MCGRNWSFPFFPSDIVEVGSGHFENQTALGKGPWVVPRAWAWLSFLAESNPVAVILRVCVFLAFGGNCRKLSSKIGHNVFGKSKKSQTLRVLRAENPGFSVFRQPGFSARHAENDRRKDICGTQY